LYLFRYLLSPVIVVYGYVQCNVGIVDDSRLVQLGTGFFIPMFVFHKHMLNNRLVDIYSACVCVCLSFSLPLSVCV